MARPDAAVEAAGALAENDLIEGPGSSNLYYPIKAIATNAKM